MPDPKSLATFLQKHRLPDDYAATAQKWFDPLTQSLATHHSSAGHPIVVGIHGCQGSGKSTLADYLCLSLTEDFGLSVASISLDDFYLTHDERKQLGEAVHPLLATRGVPGSHDVALAQQTIAGLTATESATCAIPRFDKSRDDRKPQSEWDQFAAPVDAVIFEGWCLGVTAQSEEQLATPVNELEKNEDDNGAWRSYVNHKLIEEYPSLWDLVDQWVMLRAPSFDCVLRWRIEQEQKLAKSLGANAGAKLMSEAQIARFIQHYQRLTEHALASLPEHMHYLFELDEHRRIASFRKPFEPGA